MKFVVPICSRCAVLAVHSVLLTPALMLGIILTSFSLNLLADVLPLVFLIRSIPV